MFRTCALKDNIKKLHVNLKKNNSSQKHKNNCSRKINTGNLYDVDQRGDEFSRKLEFSIYMNLSTFLGLKNLKIIDSLSLSQPENTTECTLCSKLTEMHLIA